ncbi:hypothetical protein [Providencia sp. PROV197]|jgi:hypothetical protein|uniref:hypothetical protein n=1 Tax=Providencia sp. PROV197 TaxID=2949898 RepID=UPI0023495425|nr:hypothetical protein [Providencia sp. PROV197]
MAKGKNKFRGKIAKPPSEESGRIGLSKPSKDDLPENNPPVFSLRYLQKGYCLDCCQKDEKAALADKLFTLSKLSWSEIKGLPRHGLGFEKIKSSSINASIPKHITDDVDLIAFRFFGMSPMVGYRNESTFFIVWLDRAFTLYDH